MCIHGCVQVFMSMFVHAGCGMQLGKVQVTLAHASSSFQVLSPSGERTVKRLF